MLTKKIIVLWMVFCLLLTGCAASQKGNGENEIPSDIAASKAMVSSDTDSTEQPEETHTITPLPDTTMENLSDAILSISLDEGDAYVDDSGRMQMDLKIYTYDKYDMVDIANLKVGDTVVRHSGEVKVISKEQNKAGTIYINGGLENGGFDLVTDDCETLYEIGFNDTQNWYEVRETTIRVSLLLVFLMFASM